MDMMNMMNPMAMLQEMAKNNPVMGRTLQSVNGKNMEQIEQTAKNWARLRGFNEEQFKKAIEQAKMQVQQMGFKL